MLFRSEGGNYAYDESEMRKYVLSTRSHNTIRVDGNDQNRGAYYKWEANQINQLADMSWRCGKDIDWVEGIYDECYGKEQTPSITHKRKVMLVKDIEGLEPFFIVVDRLSSNDEKVHQYEVLWHLNANKTIELPLGVMTLDEDGKNIMVKAADQPGLKLAIISGEEEPEFQGWLPVGKGLQGEYAPCPTLKYTIASEQSLRIVTILYPVKQEICTVQSIEASYEIEDKEIRLILKSGQIIGIQE